MSHFSPLRCARSVPHAGYEAAGQAFLRTRVGGHVWRPLTVLAVLISFIVSVQGDAVVDFHNHVQGVLDAPIYDTDGIQRVQGSDYFAQIFMAPRKEGTYTSAASPPSPFLTGTNAGYWWPQEVTFPNFEPEQRVWVVIRVYSTQFCNGWDPCPHIFWGESKPFSIVLQETPTPLTGLESFSLGPQGFGIRRQGSDVVIKWVNQGNVAYALETTTDPADPESWTSYWHGSGHFPAGDFLSVTNAIAGERRFFRLRAVH